MVASANNYALNVISIYNLSMTIDYISTYNLSMTIDYSSIFIPYL